MNKHINFNNIKTIWQNSKILYETYHEVKINKIHVRFLCGKKSQYRENIYEQFKVPLCFQLVTFRRIVRVRITFGQSFFFFFFQVEIFFYWPDYSIIETARVGALGSASLQTNVPTHEGSQSSHTHSFPPKHINNSQPFHSQVHNLHIQLQQNIYPGSHSICFTLSFFHTCMFTQTKKHKEQINKKQE